MTYRKLSTIARMHVLHVIHVVTCAVCDTVGLVLTYCLPDMLRYHSDISCDLNKHILTTPNFSIIFTAEVFACYSSVDNLPTKCKLFRSLFFPASQGFR